MHLLLPRICPVNKAAVFQATRNAGLLRKVQVIETEKLSSDQKNTRGRSSQRHHPPTSYPQTPTGHGNAHVQPHYSENCQCTLLVDTEQNGGANWCPPPGSQCGSHWTLGTQTPLHPVFHPDIVCSSSMQSVICKHLFQRCVPVSWGSTALCSKVCFSPHYRGQSSG